MHRSPLYVFFFLLLLSISQCHIRIAHASPNAPAIDAYLDGVKVVTGLTFKQVSAFEDADDGQHVITITATGTTQAVINATLELLEIKDYTFAAIGLLPSIQYLELVDDTRPPERDRAAFRFVHLSPDAPEVDVVLVGGPVLFRNVAYKEATEYARIAAGVQALEVRVAGTGAVVLRASHNFENSDVYSVFAEGLVKGTGVQALSAVVTLDTHIH